MYTFARRVVLANIEFNFISTRCPLRASVQSSPETRMQFAGIVYLFEVTRRVRIKLKDYLRKQFLSNGAVFI
jgi:hypothetical protein